MDQKHKDKLIANIDAMSQYEMAQHHRFDPSSSPYHQGEIGEHFQKVFKEKGGMTPEISKSLGWG